jgi:hypothetical protein
MTIASAQTVADRIERLDCPALTAQLDERSFAQTPPGATS